MSVLKDIEKLTKPVFDLPDLEDEDVDGTACSTVFRKKSVGGHEILTLRRKAIDLCADSGSKYGGTKVSRDDIFDHSDLVGLAVYSTWGENDSPEESANEASRDQVLNKSVDDKKGKDVDHEKEYNDEEMFAIEARDYLSDEDKKFGGDQSDSDSGVAKSSGVNNSSDDKDEMKDSQRTVTEKLIDTNIFMSRVDKDKQQRKAVSVYEQTRIWEQLLYLMIKVHTALRAFNQLPRGQLAKHLIKEADEDTDASLTQAQKNAVKLASLLLEGEHLLLLSSSHTKSILGVKGITDSDGEEIESSEEEDGNSHSYDEDDDVKVNGKQKMEGGVGSIPQPPSMTSKSLFRRLNEEEQRFTKFRNKILMKWDERTKFIVSGRSKNANSDFSAFEKNNILSQIEKIYADKERLLKRSRTKKLDIERIGGIVEAEEDEEVYDDDDFYQTLLKELIDKRTNSTRDPIAMTRHYIEMQKLKSKRATKKVIDHRASKDRKIKYLPIAKLISFHPAMPELVEWNNESRNELFKSLFS